MIYYKLNLSFFEVNVVQVKRKPKRVYKLKCLIKCEKSTFMTKGSNDVPFYLTPSGKIYICC